MERIDGWLGGRRLGEEMTECCWRYMAKRLLAKELKIAGYGAEGIKGVGGITAGKV